MKNLLVIFVALIFAASLEAQTQPELVARIHFLGGDKISTDANSAAFAKEFTSSQARALENQTLDKLANFFAAKFQSNTSTTVKDSAAQLRPLLNDLLKSEWILEIHDASGSPEYALAIRLSNERTQLWRKNLPTMFKIGAANGWTIINYPAEKFFTPTISSETNWLSADLNWPRLAQLFPALHEFDFPKVAFQAVGRDGNFQFTGKLNLSQPLPSLEKWRVPTNVIHEPFVSFTAARSVAPWLEKQSWFEPFLVQPQPQQVFVWALPQFPFQTFAAEPVANANTAVGQLYKNLSANQNWQNQFMLPIRMTLTNNQLSIGGIPFLSLFIRADHEADGDFLFGGFFPNTPRSKPLPAELFTRLDTPNLVYYHWEITAERLKELPQLSQLLLMVTNHRQLPGGSTAQQWLTNMAPTLGNCVTTATETSPTELSFARKAPAGLTAVELLALANWLESPKFPVLDLKLPPRPKLMPRQHAPMPLMSVPAPGQPALKK